jgi:hypothetical protein
MTTELAENPAGRLTGIYQGMDEEQYHGDQHSLSASGMKKLLKAPALYRYDLDAPPVVRDYFDVGTATHTKILGTGAATVVIDCDAKRGKAWTEPADAARAEGKTPLLRKEAEAVDRMAEAVLGHRAARRILTGGDSEVSLFWHDDRFDVTRRARVDHLTDGIGDLKTTASANPADLPRTVANFGYDLAAAQYLDVARGVGLDPAFYALVFVEKEPPHLVTVVELSADFIDRGRRLCDDALEVYRDCRDADLWPGYVIDDFTTIHPPAWAS